MKDFSRTVLVTGGSGFIGSHLVVSLVLGHPDWRVINLDVMDYCCSPRSLETVETRDNYTFIPGDICNVRLVEQIFTSENVDIVFHLAAQTHVETSFSCPAAFQRVNVEGTRVMLEAALRHASLDKFIYVSTDEVYGQSMDDKVFEETSPRRPSNPYSVTKATAERLALSYWDQHQFPVVVTRSNNVYGPRQFTEKVIPRFISLLQRDRKCTIQGTAPQSRHFLFVDDAVAALLTVMERGVAGQIYNVGSDTEVSIVQLARQLTAIVRNLPDDADLGDDSDWLEFVAERPQAERRYPISSEKLRRLGWAPAVAWAEGIRRTVTWYQDNPDYWTDTPQDPTNRL